jgi:hypothetical protein
MFCMDVKHNLVPWEKNAKRVLTAGKFLDLTGMKEVGNLEYYITRNIFM